MTGKTIEKKIEVKLTPLENIAVHVPTQEKYNTLMRVYELGGWKWVDGDLPTEDSTFGYEHNETCIDAKNRFGSASRFYNKQIKCEIISDTDFYKTQKINSNKLKQINKIFEKKK